MEVNVNKEGHSSGKWKIWLIKGFGTLAAIILSIVVVSIIVQGTRDVVAGLLGMETMDSLREDIVESERRIERLRANQDIITKTLETIQRLQEAGEKEVLGHRETSKAIKENEATISEKIRVIYKDSNASLSEEELHAAIESFTALVNEVYQQVVDNAK